MYGAFSLATSLLVSVPDYHRHGPYDAAIPTPQSVLGFTVGSRHTDIFLQEKVVNAIAEAGANRVRRMDYGKSTEGRPLRVFAISSPGNMARLDEIQRGMAKLAHDPQSAEAKALVKSSPAIVWVNQCIHGDETASFESSMELMYNLVASRDPKVMAALENVVVILNPAYNPDGHDRYVTAYNSIPNGNPERGTYDRSIPSAFFGRANHYRFDMNRDRVAMSQAETRQEVRMFLQWNPQVYVDQHGQVETYFFPPVQQSVNANVDRARYEKWTEIFGRATGRNFDQRGWTYYIRDQFDFFNVCYLDSHTTLMGAIGMTHETDGGRVMAERRSDGTILTLADGIEKHLDSALTVIKTAANKREELLASYQSFKERAVSGSHAGKLRRVVVTSQDPRELERLATLLGRSGVKSAYAATPWTQNGTSYWTQEKKAVKFPAGALVVDMAQSQGPLAKALLEPSAEFEPEFIKRQLELAKNLKAERPDPELDSYEFYDSTAWSLPYSFNLEAWWSEETPSLKTAELVKPRKRAAFSPVGFYLPYRDQADILAVAKLLRQGVRVSIVTRAMKVGGDTLEPGTFLFLRARNDERALDALVADDIPTVHALPTSYPDEGRQGPGSGSVYQLIAPRIGLAMGEAGRLAGGPTWYLMDQEFKLPFESLASSALNGDLSGFTAIVAPEGAVSSMSSGLRSWISAGGTLVCLGGGTWATGESNAGKVDMKSAEQSLPGTFYKATLDPYSWLSYGYARRGLEPITVCVPQEGDSFYKTPTGGGVIDLIADPKAKKLLSGWEFPDSEKDLAGTSWLLEKRLGRGRVVLFSQDPTWRAQYPGLWKLYLNSILLGTMR